MKSKSKIILFVIFISLIIFQNVSFASKNVSRYFGAEKVVSSNGEDIGYAITFPGINAKIIHTLKEHTSKDESSPVIENYPTVYCLKAEKGFDHPGAIDSYDIEYDMLNEKEGIGTINEMSYQLTKRGIDKVIALLNIMYIPGKSSEEYKEKLLAASREKFQIGYTNLISDVEINAVNQAALWKYTNPENPKIFTNYNVEEWITYSHTGGEDYEFLSKYKEETGEGLDRKAQMEALYKYIMDFAEGQVLDGEQVNDTCTVNVDELDLKERPGKTANVLAKLNKDTSVTRTVKEISYVDGIVWDKIKIEDGTEGYVESEKLTITSTNEKSFVSTWNPGDTVSLRQEPTAASERIKYVEDRTPITILEKNVNEAQIYLWDKVQLEDGTIGYMADQYVEPIEQTEGQEYKIETLNDGDLVRLRRGPSTSSEILYKVTDGDVVTKLDSRISNVEGYMWDRIKLSNGKEGYVPSQYVKPTNRVKEYDINNITGSPVEIESDNVKYEFENSNYIIGPINVKRKNQLFYNIDITLKNGKSNNVEYTLLNSEKEPTEQEELKNGGEFYVSVSKDDIKDLSMQIDTNYEETQIQLLASTQDQEEKLQILAEPFKNIKNNTVQKEVKVFDLALREYITQVNDVDLTSTRVPKIDKTSLEGGTTATYNHAKNPLEIFEGDEVTLEIAVYNEGKQKGKATEITSKIPKGLKFLSVETNNYTADYNEDDNVIVLKDNGARDLESYKKEEDLDTEIIKIKCKAETLPEEKENDLLTNITWISKEYNVETQQEIINQEGLDIDSEPATKPNVDINTEEYKGGTRPDGSENKDVTEIDPNYYWVGQQDDDDFEKILLKERTEGSSPSSPEPTQQQKPSTSPAPTQNIIKEETKKQQSNQSNTIIPKAGRSIAIVLALVLIINAVIAYKKYKNLPK